MLDLTWAKICAKNVQYIIRAHMIHLERTACTSLSLFTYKTKSPVNTAVPFALLFMVHRF